MFGNKNNMHISFSLLLFWRIERSDEEFSELSWEKVQFFGMILDPSFFLI